jgi:hypothetical protein
VFDITGSQSDTFIFGLVSIAKSMHLTVDPSFFYGTTGQGARFTLAMNVKRGKFIGHPSSIYAWDIISVIEHCFPDAGIVAEAYLGEGYGNRARSTSAQSSREVPDNIHLISSDALFPEITGNLLIAHPEGRWFTAPSTADIDIEWDRMPFGPVVINILEIKPHDWVLPRRTLNYLIDTLERGEEPMEVVGRHDLNAVSGWKAFARWMQSFTVPLPDIRHPFLSELPPLLLDRRTNQVHYLRTLADQLENQEHDLIAQLAERYQEMITPLEHLVNSEPDLDSVRTAYFAEQSTQSIFKKIDTYLTYGN